MLCNSAKGTMANTEQIVKTNKMKIPAKYRPKKILSRDIGLDSKISIVPFSTSEEILTPAKEIIIKITIKGQIILNCCAAKKFST